jgi:hypothetical protein
MTELCEVVITAPDPDWLYSFARKLVEDRLAASAHNFTPGAVDLPMAGPGIRAGRGPGIAEHQP